MIFCFVFLQAYVVYMGASVGMAKGYLRYSHLPTCRCCFLLLEGKGNTLLLWVKLSVFDRTHLMVELGLILCCW